MVRVRTTTSAVLIVVALKSRLPTMFAPGTTLAIIIIIIIIIIICVNGAPSPPPPPSAGSILRFDLTAVAAAASVAAPLSRPLGSFHGARTSSNPAVHCALTNTASVQHWSLGLCLAMSCLGNSAG
jgi:hypothetical protein